MDPAVCHIVGYPVREAFLSQRGSSSSCYRRQQAGRTDPLVLLTGGGIGSGEIRAAFRALAASSLRVRIHVLTGSNRRLLRQLRREAGPTVDVRPWIDNVASVCAAADVIVAKAGPSTIFEAEAVGRPLLLTAEVGVQERGNIELAEKRGIGVRCSRPDLVPGYVRDELSALHDARPLASPEDFPSIVIARALRAAVQSVREGR